MLLPTTPGTSLYGQASDNRSPTSNMRHAPPFKLMVCIHQCEHLPTISETVTCNPYIIALVNDKTVGQSSVIFDSMLPSWEEYFEVALLNNACTLLLYVMHCRNQIIDDEDYVLGYVSVDISQLPYNKTSFYNLPLTSSKDITTSSVKGQLSFSIYLFKNDAIIKIIQTNIDDSYDGKIHTDNNDECEDSFDCNNTAYINGVLNDMEASDTVRKAINQSVFMKQDAFFNKRLVQDLLYDVSSMVRSKKINYISDSNAIENLSIRSSSTGRGMLQLLNTPMISSTIIDLSSHIYKHMTDYPIAEIGIRIACKDASPMLRIGNKYLQWKWLRWLRLAYEVWHGTHHEPIPTPIWAENQYISNIFTISNGDDRYYGRCTLDLKKPFLVCCDNVDTGKTLLRLNIETMRYLVLAVDAALSSHFILQIEIEKATVAANYRDMTALQMMQQSADNATTVQFDTNNAAINSSSSTITAKQSSRRQSFVNSMVNIITLNNLGNSNSSNSNNNSMSINNRSMGNSGKASNFAHRESVVSMKLYAQTRSRPLLRTRRWSCFVLIKHGHLIYKTNEVVGQLHSGSYIEWKECIYANIDAENVGVKGKYIEIYFYYGLAGDEKLLGQERIPISQLIPQSIGYNGSSSSSSNTNIHEVDVSLNSYYGYQVILISADGIAPQYSHPGNKTYVKCRFARWNGHDRGKQFAVLKSKEVKACYSPIFGDHSFILNAKDGMEWAAYVRLEVHIKSVSADECIGSVFIPLHKFDDNFEQHTFPITYYRDTAEACRETIPSKGFGLGNVTVQIRSITDFNDSYTTIGLRSILHETSEYNTMWPTDCILSGCLDTEGKTVEACCISPLFDHLLIQIPNNKDVLDKFGDDKSCDDDQRQSISSSVIASIDLNYTESVDRVSSSSVISSDGRSGEAWIDGDDSLGSRAHINTPNQFEVYVFENELPLCDSRNAQQQQLYHQYSDETGSIESGFHPSITDEAAPEGYVWASNWTIDDNGGLQIDYYGWFYGRLCGNAVRRRRWKRLMSLSATASGSSGSDNLNKELDDIIISDSSTLLDTSGICFTDRTDDSIVVEEMDSGEAAYNQYNIEDCMAIELFENERKLGHAPYTWSSSHLFSYDRSPYSDESGAHTSGFSPAERAERPPVGYAWASSWKVDKGYATTDSDGWVYGVDFGCIMSSLRKGTTAPAHSSAQVRRRKWIRLVHPDSGEIRDDDANSNDIKQQIPLIDRAKDIAVNRDAILHLCKERNAYNTSILIPWSQVLGVEVVTPSVLYISFEVHRYFGTNLEGVEEYRVATIEAFVTNCPAFKLKSLFDERTSLIGIRDNIKTLIATGHLSGSSNRSGDDSVEAASSININSNNVIEAKELSMGSETIAILDIDASVLEERTMELISLYEDEEAEKGDAIIDELMVIMRRATRLRLYVALLLGEGLEGIHDFTEEAVHKLMNNDFLVAKSIVHDDAVIAANNKIEYLLDTAEMRIRDSALCGWSHQGGVLERCLEVFINGFFIEMIGVLTSFFNENTVMSGISSSGKRKKELKGLESKMKLITLFMKHNDRLDTLLGRALRPYASMVVDPQPHLTLFLDFKTLLLWYTKVLEEEMANCVLKAAGMWKDSSKDASGEGSKFLYKLPWYPMRRKQSSGAFISLLPEDVTSYLMSYLQATKFTEQNIAPFFRKSLDMFDSKICLSYSSSFIHLYNTYDGELCSKDWLQCDVGLSDDQIFEQLDEHIVWLSSAANDARRVIEESMMLIKATTTTSNTDSEYNHEYYSDRTADFVTPSKATNALSDSALTAIVVERLHSCFAQVCTHAIDEVSNIVFEIITDEMGGDERSSSSSSSSSNSSNKKKSMSSSIASFLVGSSSSSNASATCNDDSCYHWNMFDNQSLYSDWQRSSRNYSSSSVLVQLLLNLEAFLDARCDYFEPFCYYKLLSVCADKVIIVCFKLIRCAYELSKVYTRSCCEVQQMMQDVSTIKDVFKKLCDKSVSTQHYCDALLSKFKRLDQAMVIIACELTSEQLPEQLKSLLKTANSNPVESRALATFTAVCYNLRANEVILDEYKNVPVSQGAGNDNKKVTIASNTINRHGSRMVASLAAGLSRRLSTAGTSCDTTSMVQLYIDQMLEEAEESHDPGDRTHHDTSRSSSRKQRDISPEYKVFGDGNEYATCTLYDLLVCSKKIRTKYDFNRNVVSNINTAMSGILNNVTNAVVLPQLRKDDWVLGSPNKYSVSVCDGSDKINSYEAKVIFTNVKVTNLFLMTDKPPDTYLTFHMSSSIYGSGDCPTGGYSVKSKVRKGSTNPSWEDDEFECNFRFEDLEDTDIVIILFYKRRYSAIMGGDEQVGKIRVRVSTLMDAGLNMETFVFDFSSSSLKVLGKLEDSMTRTIQIPKIQLSCSRLII